MSDAIRRHSVKTTFISKLPWVKRQYQSYLPLMPLALEQLDLREYDLVISSESGPAKGVITRPTLLMCATATLRCATSGICTRNIRRVSSRRSVGRWPCCCTGCANGT